MIKEWVGISYKRMTLIGKDEPRSDFFNILFTLTLNALAIKKEAYGHTYQ